MRLIVNKKKRSQTLRHSSYQDVTRIWSKKYKEILGKYIHLQYNLPHERITISFNITEQRHVLAART